MEPSVYKRANLRAATISTGKYAAAIEKHKIPMPIQPMKPIFSTNKTVSHEKRSHLLSVVSLIKTDSMGLLLPV